MLYGDSLVTAKQYREQGWAFRKPFANSNAGLPLVATTRTLEQKAGHLMRLFEETC